MTIVVVTVADEHRADDPEIGMRRWLRDNDVDFDDEYNDDDHEWDRAHPGFIRWYVDIKDPAQALMFKLTWGGQ